MRRLSSIIVIILALASSHPAFATNLISNWSFEDGYSDFWTDYIYPWPGDQYVLLHEGGYAVGYHANPTYRNDSAFDAAYPYLGSNFFMANGSSDTTDVVWQSDSIISVAYDHTVYRFEAYICSLVNAVYPYAAPSLVFKLGDGTTFLNLTTKTVGYSTSAGVWYLVYADGEFNKAGNYYLRLVNNQSAAAGNDFGLDAIYFGLATEAPTITTTPVTTYGSYTTSSLASIPNITGGTCTVSQVLSNSVGSTFDGGTLIADSAGASLDNVFWSCLLTAR